MAATNGRIGLLFGGLLAIFVIAFMRSAWIQVVEGGDLSAQAQAQQVDAVPVPGRRGAIVDREGRALAVSEDSATIFATPYQLNDAPEQLAQISALIDVPVDDLEAAVADGSSGFAYLAHDVDLRAARKVEKLGFEGVGSIPDSRRYYPQGSLAAQVLGVVGSDQQGLVGLEVAYDGQLGGVDGELEVTRDARGTYVDREVLTQSSPGKRIKLTLDSDIQAHVDAVLAQVGETYQPKGATAIVMDPKTSQVLAMSSWPPANPGKLGKDPLEELINRATGTIFEPGSTFKAITIAAGLEENLITPETKFDLPPTIQVADRVIEESHARGPLTLSTAEILAQSSNVGAVTIGLLTGSDGVTFDKWIRRFGFGAPTGVELPGEEPGIVLDPSDYSGSTMGNLPIGQGLSVTPLQMMAAYGAIANGGVLREPQIVLRDGEGRVRRDRGERILSPTNARAVAKMLEGVLAAGGTASEVQVPGYVLAGKTGTAQKVVDGAYSDSAFVGSFIGFAPARDPEIVVSVVVDEPSQNGYYGGIVAAPAFGDIAEFTLPYLGIAPD